MDRTSDLPEEWILRLRPAPAALAGSVRRTKRSKVGVLGLSYLSPDLCVRPTSKRQQQISTNHIQIKLAGLGLVVGPSRLEAQAVS